MAIPYNNNYHESSPFSDVTPRMTLTNNQELTYTVPGNETNSLQAVFSYPSESSIFVGYNTAAVIPAPNTLVTAGRVEFKPLKKIVKGGDVLHFITPDAITYVGISFMSLS